MNLEPHMDASRSLAPCLVGRGTVTSFRDMLRSLETLENLDYRYLVHGEVVDSGRAALVKLMADPDSTTLVVNGCLFLNVASFRYMDFERAEDDAWMFSLHGDDAILELISVPETEEEALLAKRPHLLSEEIIPDFESLIALDEDDEDE